jgi:branched-chain amino acid transport system substrate-binding protein
MSDRDAGGRPLSRRSVLRAAGAGAAVLGGGGLLAACSSASPPASAAAPGQGIVIGFIHPLTGTLRSYGSPDSWITSAIMATPQFQNGLQAGHTIYPVTIKSYDTGSSPARAGQLARTAIMTDHVDLIVTSSTMELVNPVATVAEQLGTPAICATAPWQAWYANLGGNPAAAQPAFKPSWVTMYGTGTDDVCRAFIPMWNKIHGQVGTNLTVAGLFAGDVTGDAFRSAWPAYTAQAGYTMVDPAAYRAGAANYGPFVNRFKAGDCEVFTSGQPAADFAAFWKQAARQGYQPKLATGAGIAAFPSDAAALGSLASNVAVSAWWTPNMTWLSSLTGQSCPQLAAAYTAATGAPWIQSLSNFSLFEVAHAALTSVSNPHDKAEVARALFNVNIQGIAGMLDWTSSSNPAPGVVDLPCLGAQWKLTSKGAFLQVVDNTLMPQVALTGKLEPTYK